MRIIWFGVCLLLISCSPGELVTATIPAVQADVPIIRAAATATIPASPSPTPIPPTLTPTALPTATPEPTRTPSPTRTPTPSPWLVEDFSSFLFYNDGYDIYLVRPSGERRLIAQGLLWNGQPWSPDGLKFVYDPGSDLTTHSATIADLVTGQTQLLDRDLFSGVYWSPDGKYLFYSKGDFNSDIELMIYDFDRQTSQLLFEIPKGTSSDFVFLPAGWSSDSRQVAFIAKLDGQYDLFVIEVETQTLRQLTFSLEAETLAAWSPVANQLVVVTSPNEWIVNPPFFAEKLQVINDTGAELLSLGPYVYLSTASWSPDGQRIAYSADKGLCIFDITNMSSSCPLEITNFALGYAIAQRSPADWSADGNWLAFQGVPVPVACSRLFLLDLRTNTVVDPEFPSCTDSYIHWSRAAP